MWLVLMSLFVSLTISLAISPGAQARWAPHPLDELFEGRAHLEEVRTIDYTPLNQNTLEFATASMIVEDGVWYAFNRQPVQTPHCREAYRVVVRESRDKGQTWSQFSVVADTNEAYPCGAVDGGAYYDREQRRWHFLAQCIHGGRWNLCHFYKDGASALGTYKSNPANPVVTPSSLFNRIPGAEGFWDEGTPDILYKWQGYFYVTFHGFNGKNGIRAVARTRDFKRWETSGRGLPGVPVFTSQDCQGWSVRWDGGCIGSGHASTFVTPRYHYMLIEASDTSLLCIAGQNWVFGLVRAPYLAATGQWESYSHNPIIRNPGTGLPCPLQYQHIFEDDGTVYFYFGYGEPGGRHYPNKLYKIAPGAGPRQINLGKDPVIKTGVRELPQGSYLLSCSACSQADSLLKCQCLDSVGQRRATSVDVRTCTPGIDLANINGELRCQ